MTILGPNGQPMGTPVEQPKPLAGVAWACIIAAHVDGHALVWPLDVERELVGMTGTVPGVGSVPVVLAQSPPKYIDAEGNPTVGMLKLDKVPGFIADQLRDVGFPMPGAPTAIDDTADDDGDAPE